LFCISACAGNRIRVDTASEVHTAAGAFVNDANSALNEARRRRLEANAALVASDPSCLPLERIVVQRRTGAPPRRGRTPLCAEDASPRLGYSNDVLALRPITEEQLKPTIFLIGAIGDYGAALGKIAARPDADISKELGAFAGKAQAAAAIANSLLGANIPNPEKALASSQGKAALALLDFFVRLDTERRKVRDINALVVDRGAKVEAVIPLLRSQLRNWIIAVSQGDAQIYQNSLVRAYENERSSWSFDQRLAFATRVNESRAASAAAPARARQVEAALGAFQKAQADLRRVLAGNFNAQEKRRMARIQGERMLEALDLISKTVVAFGGV
jgi:hypothetical protein